MARYSGIPAIFVCVLKSRNFFISLTLADQLLRTRYTNKKNISLFVYGIILLVLLSSRSEPVYGARLLMVRCIMSYERHYNAALRREPFQLKDFTMTVNLLVQNVCTTKLVTK